MADLTSIHGVIDSSGNVIAGSGFAVTRVNTGVYEVQLKIQSANVPAVVGSQVLYQNQSQNPLDNVVFPFVNQYGFTAVTGDSAGNPSNRSFAFIAIGT